jgi:hypothetical protein
MPCAGPTVLCAFTAAARGKMSHALKASLAVPAKPPLRESRRRIRCIRNRQSQCKRICARRHTTNTVEGYFSIFKRGMRGVYQHCGEKHLHRYLAEFDFRFNHRIALGFTDRERATLAMKGTARKRLTYRSTN